MNGGDRIILNCYAEMPDVGIRRRVQDALLSYLTTEDDMIDVQLAGRIG